MNIDVTKISSKGQVVIPQEVRDMLDLEEGAPLALAVQDDLIVLKKIEDPFEKEDIETFHEIKEAWLDIEEGECISLDSDDFIVEISKW